MTPDRFREQFRETRASAILRTHDQTLARRAMEAAVAGGFVSSRFAPEDVAAGRWDAITNRATKMLQAVAQRPDNQ